MGNKLRLITILEILKEKTDNNHPMAKSELEKELQAKGFEKVDRRVLYDDIKILQAHGDVGVDMRRGAMFKCWALDEKRSFTVSEMIILANAIQELHILTQKKTCDLIEKIVLLGGGHCAQFLRDNLIDFNDKKSEDEDFYENFQNITKAIVEKKKVKFKHKGVEIEIVPISLVLKQGKYIVLYKYVNESGENREQLLWLNSMKEVEIGGESGQICFDNEKIKEYVISKIEQPKK